MLARELGLLDARFNIVLMGMGEPLHNYDETMKALRILGDEDGLAVSPRRVTLSTVGVVPALERLAEEPFMPNLAISLHATNEAQRDLLVPLNRKYNIAEVIEACRRFPVKRRSRITFEYVMLADVNDSPADARRLVSLLNGIRAKVNLIPLNEAAGIPFARPSDERVDEFAQDPRRPPPHRVGAQEPRPRHPRGVRPADRRRHPEVGRPETRRRDGVNRGEREAERRPEKRQRCHVTTSPDRGRAEIDPQANALVPPAPRRDPHLQVVVGQRHGPVVQRQRGAIAAELALDERRVELAGDLAQDRGAAPNLAGRHLGRHRAAVVPGRSE